MYGNNSHDDEISKASKTGYNMVQIIKSQHLKQKSDHRDI